MFVRIASCRISVTLLAMCLFTATVAAQIPANPVPRVSQEGKIVALAGGAIQVMTADRQAWMLQITKDTSVMLTGKADATFLTPGAFVKFQAEVNRRQKGVRPVDAFQVFTPTKQDIPGAFPSQGFGPSSDTASNQHGESGDQDAKKPGRAATRPADRIGQKPHQGEKESAGDEAGELYEIVGRITGARQGVLTVNYGKGSLEIETAENASVELALTDLRFARPGDRIFFDGIVVGNEASRMLRAVTLQITRAAPDGDKDQPEPGRQGGEPGRHKTETPTDSSPAKQAAQLSPEQAKAVETFVKMLALKRVPTNPEEFRIDGDPTEFEPCSRHSIKVLERRFGKPEKTEVEGILTMRGREKSSKWSMLRWGPIKVIVDRSQKTRFYTVEK